MKCKSRASCRYCSVLLVTTVKLPILFRFTRHNRPPYRGQTLADLRFDQTLSFAAPISGHSAGQRTLVHKQKLRPINR
jgi:hypothetical protein